MSVVEYLIQKGMSSDIRDRLFRTPLHVACMHGFAVIAEYLI
jgi:ankyrin repeat protein